jgi:hypothetical protein
MSLLPRGSDTDLSLLEVLYLHPFVLSSATKHSLTKLKRSMCPVRRLVRAQSFKLDQCAGDSRYCIWRDRKAVNFYIGPTPTSSMSCIVPLTFCNCLVDFL